MGVRKVSNSKNDFKSVFNITQFRYATLTLAHCQPSLKTFMQIRAEVFLRKVANRQTDRRTNKKRRKHNLLGGGN